MTADDHTAALEHLLTLARQGAQPEASQNEQKARRILELLMSDVLGLDAVAVAGIGAAAEQIRAGGFDAIDRLRDTIDPQSPENTNSVHFIDLRFEESGPRHYLAGKPLHAGDLIRVWINHAWETARYEWSYNPDRPGTAWFAEDEGIEIKDDTKLRWAEPE